MKMNQRTGGTATPTRPSPLALATGLRALSNDGFAAVDLGSRMPGLARQRTVAVEKS